jgi:hypothetical protein
VSLSRNNPQKVALEGSLQLFEETFLEKWVKWRKPYQHGREG